MEPKTTFITAASRNGKSKIMFQELKKAFKHMEKAAFAANDAFDAFTFGVKQFMEEKSMEKKCKFKVGDKVIGNSKATEKYMLTKKGYVGTVTDIKNVLIEQFELPGTYIVLDGKWIVDEDCFDLYTPHEGKILIMVDEKDNNKIIARDLVTNKTAEAKCSPKEEWDFHKGAKLALERLTEPKKPKGWTGKVVCVCNNVDCECDWFYNNDFVVGKVYAVKDGHIISEQHRAYTGIMLITSPEQLSWTDASSLLVCPYRCKFIEYKGGAEE